MAQKYSDETRGQVMAALLTGQSVSSIARQYDIPKGTVSSWKRGAWKLAGTTASESTQKSEIGDLLLDYLGAALRTLRRQVEIFSDGGWLKKQSASEAAVLHGVLADKTIRLLEALSATDTDGHDE